MCETYEMKVVIENSTNLPVLFEYLFLEDIIKKRI